MKKVGMLMLGLVLLAGVASAEITMVTTNYYNDLVVVPATFGDVGDTGLTVSNAYVCFSIAEIPQLTEAETAADVGELMYGLLEYLYDQIEALASTNTPVNFTVKESVGASVSGTNIFVDVQHKIQSKRPATTAGMAAE